MARTVQASTQRHDHRPQRLSQNRHRLPCRWQFLLAGNSQPIANRKVMRRLATLILLFATLAHADEIDDMVSAEMRASHAPGLALAIVRDGKVIRTGAYGIANLETKTPVSPETVFRVASMSKQFCASAAMLLVQDGKWTLEDPISKHLAKCPESWSKITIRHLLTHTSGMAQLQEADGFTFRTNPGPDRYIEMLAKKPLRNPPGNKYEYSNEGYSLLGILVGNVAGKAMNEFVRERIFQPLGMSSTFYYRLEDLVPNRANGYIWNTDHFDNAIPLRPYAMAGSGGIQSTVLDFAKWDAALYTDSPLAKSLREQMWTSAKLNDGKETGYGFGWGVRTRNGKRILAHTGSTPGFNSKIVRHIDDKLTVIVFENVANGGAPKLADQIADWFLQDRVPRH